MMTSRSEYRLLLRQDNADARLTPIGRRVGLIDDDRYARFLAKREAIDAEIERLNTTYVSPEKANPLLSQHDMPDIISGVSLGDLIRRPQLDYEAIASLDKKRPELSRAVKNTVEVNIKYEGYIKKQKAEIARMEKLEEKKLPADIDYKALKGLRIEAAQKLDALRPLTVGQASRISGVNPADISVLLIYLGLK